MPSLNPSLRLACTELDCPGKFFCCLMPVTNAVSIALVYLCGAALLKDPPAEPAPLPVFAALALFQALWAVRNNVAAERGPLKGDMGWLTCGLVFVGGVLDNLVSPMAGHIVAIIGGVLVVLSFIFVWVAMLKCGKADPVVMATRGPVAKTLLWANVLKVYMFISLLVWCAILVLLIIKVTKL